MKKVIGILLAAVMALGLFGCSASDYKKAEAAMESGDYAGAKEIFDGLGDYKDSAELGKKCGYEVAVAKFEAEDYSGAKVDFEALGEYSDSEEYVQKAMDGIIFHNIVGEWEAEVDYSETVKLLLNGWSDNSGFGLRRDVIEEVPDIMITLHLTVNDDGTVSAYEYIKPEDAELLDEMLLEWYRELARETIPVACESMGITVEEWLEEQGAESIDEALEDMLSEMEDELSFSELSDPETTMDTGTVTVENGEIIIMRGYGDETGVYNVKNDTIEIDFENSDALFMLVFDDFVYKRV